MCEFISNLGIAEIIGSVIILLAVGIAMGMALASESHRDISNQQNKHIRDLFDELLNKYYVMPGHAEDYRKRLEQILKEAK
jgi:hypothetical protein